MALLRLALRKYTSLLLFFSANERSKRERERERERESWMYAARTINDLESGIAPVDQTIRSPLVPAMLDRLASSDLQWDLLTLPTRLGGLGLPSVKRLAQQEYGISVAVTAPLTALICILEQKSSLESVSQGQQQLKTAAVRTKTVNLQAFAQSVVDRLPPQGKQAVELAKEKGSSSWLNTLPIAEHGFDLSEAAFRDAVSLRYGWEIANLPSMCSCGAHFDTTHALQCPTGGFTMTQHNEVRDILSDSLRDVCSEVTVEPSLVPVTGEQFGLRSASTADSEARLDIAASGFFGGRFERAFFDVRVFSPFARSNHWGTLNAVYRRQEQEKRRKYGQRVRELEHASFVPLVFTCTGGAGPAATTFLKRLADRISSTHQLSYNEAIVCFEPGSRLHSFVQAWCAFEDRGHIEAEESTWTPSQ